MQKKKLLLVDDSPTILALERLLLRPDYDITTAQDGRDGLAKAVAERPDLILLDLVMPGMTGLQVCKALRADEATRQTPIIMLSSHTEVRSMKAGYRSGCSAYLTKPINGPQLIVAIKRCLCQ
jgi:CheY-like chemotaxis protein